MGSQTLWKRLIGRLCSMDFDYDAKTLDLRKQLLTFMEERVYPTEAVYTEQVEAGPGRRGPQGAGARPRAVEPVPARQGRPGRRPEGPEPAAGPAADQPAVRAAGRGHRVESRAGARGDQLRRAR